MGLVHIPVPPVLGSSVSVDPVVILVPRLSGTQAPIDSRSRYIDIQIYVFLRYTYVSMCISIY